MSFKDAHLDKALGFPGAGKLIAEKGLNALNDELKRRGETSKQHTPEQPKQETSATAPQDWTPLLDETLRAIGTHEEAIETTDKARKTDAETTTKALTEANVKIDTLTKQLNDLTKEFKAFVDATPKRASQADSTKLSADEEAKAQKAIQDRNQQFDPAFPGMNVPLKTV